MALLASFRELMQRLHRAVLECYGADLTTLAVFGSVARGTPGPESDLDVLVICRQLPSGRMRRVAQFECVEDALDPYIKHLAREGLVFTRLSPIFKTDAEARRGSHLFLDMTHHVILLSDRDQFFASLLSALKQRLNRRGAHRVEQGSRWYWQLNPAEKDGKEVELWPGAH